MALFIHLQVGQYSLVLDGQRSQDDSPRLEVSRRFMTVSRQDNPVSSQGNVWRNAGAYLRNSSPSPVRAAG